MSMRNALSVLLVSSLLLIPSLAGAADLATVDVTADLVTFQPQIPYSQVRVTVTGPAGFAVVKSFAAGEVPSVQLSGADGHYKYELRFAPELNSETQATLARGRAEGSGSDAGLGGDAATDKRTVQRGWFSLAGGSVVPKRQEPPPKVVLTNANGVIRNALCVGVDCPDSPAFGDSSVLMMENNNRIKFGDTSAAPFPNNDWEIEANSNVSGGANYLGFNDCGTADNDGDCATDLVFAIEAGARQSALYVESDGDVGIGTSNPVTDLHIVTGNTPTMRLDQDGSSGFAPQVWDLAGNETSFFIRDVTGGSRLPFRIQPVAPSNSLFILNDGDVVLGGTSADADVRLQINANTSANFGGLRVKNTGTGNVQTQFAGNTWEWRQTFRSGDLIFDSQEDGANELVLTTGGVLTVTSVVQTSDKNLKENVESVKPGDILDRLATIPIQRWNFTEDQADTPHLGPMAQDFYAAFGLGSDDKHIAATDADGVALAAIQALNQRLLAAVEKLEAENHALAARLEALEAMEP
ncbi:MAG: tail fiber domain-containing protein [Acidobacteria bacterium]|nr:tail fiber domain-containing protein [Acidobacteriota bacterium]